MNISALFSTPAKRRSSIDLEARPRFRWRRGIALLLGTLPRRDSTYTHSSPDALQFEQQVFSMPSHLLCFLRHARQAC
jgi:hypothetical protein